MSRLTRDSRSVNARQEVEIKKLRRQTSSIVVAAATLPYTAGTGIIVAGSVISLDYAAVLSDEAYDATTWNGVTTIAPSKNAVRDKFETLGTLSTQNGTFSGTSSGTNTGDNAVNSLYSGLVSNATHTGEVTGATTLTIDRSTVFTWTAVHTFSAQDVHNAGVSLGTSGRLNSAVTDGAGVSSFLYQPSVALTSGTDRYIHRFLDSTGAYGLQMNADMTFSFLGSAGSNLSGAHIGINQAIGSSVGINFAPTMNAPTGATYGKASSILGAQFIGIPASNASPSGYVIGGFFAARTGTITSGNNPTGFLGALFRAGDTMAANSGKTFAELGGWRIMAAFAAKNAGTFTDVYGGYIENQTEALSGVAYTNLSGLIIEEQTGGGTINNGIQFKNATAGYKAITIRDQNAAIGSSAAGRIDIIATEFLVNTTKFGTFNIGPIARVTNAVAAAAFVANTSGIANDTATWGGYTAGQVVQALQNYGILT